MADISYQEAQEAVNRIQRLSDEHWHVLDAPCRAMDEGAWIGPEARAFRDEVGRERRELQSQLAEAVHLAREKLKSIKHE
jgi:hypothetical protein